MGSTPYRDTVYGDTAITVTLGTVQGRPDFTGLHAAGGVMWDDGDSGYTIVVGSNYLRSTGGDAGTVNGQFYGNNHESVSGSLERADLTAAFGGKW